MITFCEQFEHRPRLNFASTCLLNCMGPLHTFSRSHLLKKEAVGVDNEGR